MSERTSLSPVAEDYAGPARYHLPDERKSKTVEFTVYPPREDSAEEPPEPVHGYFTVGLFDDGTPGELFVTVDKQGSEIHGWADCWAISISLLLQFGVRPEKIYSKFKFQDFQPHGMSTVPAAPFCKSIVDLIMKWMEQNLPPTKKSATEAEDYSYVIESATEVAP